MLNTIITMPGRIKKGGYRGGRGYCGYFTTCNNDVIFLRSLKEFIFASFLNKEKINYKYEVNVFNINGHGYKPDFFIYDNNKNLIKIIEIKESKDLANKYLSMYSEYFNSIGIKYEAYHNLNPYKKLISKDEIQSWIDSYIDKYDYINQRGTNNPMSGMSHSDETKEKIGKKTRERMQDDKFKQKLSDSHQKFWNSADGDDLRKKLATLRTNEAKIKNPIITVNCDYCGKQYERKLKARYHKNTCSLSCANKLYNKTTTKIHTYNGKLGYQTKLIKYGKLVPVKDFIKNPSTWDDNILNYKKNNSNLIPVTFSMTKNTIEKYFGTLSNFLNEIQK